MLTSHPALSQPIYATRKTASVARSYMKSISVPSRTIARAFANIIDALLPLFAVLLAFGIALFLLLALGANPFEA